MEDDFDYDQNEIAEIAKDLESGDGLHLIRHKDIAIHQESPACHCGPKLIFRDMRRNVEIWKHYYLRDILN